MVRRDLVQFIGALVIIKPWLTKTKGGMTNTPEHLMGSSVGILIAGFVMFSLLAFFGQVVLYLENDIETIEDNITKLVSGAVPKGDPDTIVTEKMIEKSLDSHVDDQADKPLSST